VGQLLDLRSNETSPHFRLWPEAADRGCPRIGRDQGQTGRFMLGMSLSARDPLETSRRLAFLGSFVNIVRMTVVVITSANLWWRST
jgi:hypothetical protein